MAALENIFPNANRPSFGDNETARRPNPDAATPEPFDHVMSRALSPREDDSSAAQGRQPRPGFAGAQKQHSPATTTPAAPAPAASTPPADAPDAGTPAKSKTSGKPDGEAGGQGISTGSTAAADGTPSASVDLPVPTLAVFLPAASVPAASGPFTAGNSAAAAVLPAGPEGTSNPAAAATVADIEVKATGAVAEAVSQLASSTPPQPVAVKNSGAAKAAATEQPAGNAGAKTGDGPAAVPKISELAATAETVPNPVAAVSTQDSPPAHSGDAVRSPEAAAETALADPAKPHGTSVAKQDLPMKNTAPTNKAAGPGEKVLPVDVLPAARENNLPGRVSSPPAAARLAPGETNFAAVSALPDSPARSAGPAEVAAAVATVSEARSEALERTHYLVALHAMRLTGAGSDSLQVVIKPDAGTQLSLELRQRGGGIEAQAVLQAGDFENLKQHWPELQQRLEQRGIKLAPLTSGDHSATAGGGPGLPNRQDQPAEREPVFYGVPASFGPGLAAPHLPVAPAIQTASSRGWQTWA